MWDKVKGVNKKATEKQAENDIKSMYEKRK